ncbi:MAG TPA: hypothetical protein VE684_06385 [Crenalkalicoccus sp.]|nr:hypothetical protein [Crenalkalicoccus sp.]
MRDEPPLPQSLYSRGERCPQNCFDPVVHFAREFPCVAIRHETELLSFEDDSSRSPKPSQ